MDCSPVFKSSEKFTRYLLNVTLMNGGEFVLFSCITAHHFRERYGLHKDVALRRRTLQRAMRVTSKKMPWYAHPRRGLSIDCVLMQPQRRTITSSSAYYWDGFTVSGQGVVQCKPPRNYSSVCVGNSGKNTDTYFFSGLDMVLTLCSQPILF